MSLRATLDHEIQDLTESLITMGTAIERTIEQTVRALLKQDVALAESVIAGDDYFDQLEIAIENKAVAIISTQQPVASDLRKIFSTIKIVTDMERIADHCGDISKITIALAGQTYVKPLVDIPKMAQLVKDMVRMTIDCFIEHDVIKARLICANDDAIDDYYQLVIQDVSTMLQQSPENADQLLRILMIAKYFERMGDHATNIAEWVIYSVEGKHYGAEVKQAIARQVSGEMQRDEV